MWENFHASSSQLESCLHRRNRSMHRSAPPMSDTSLVYGDMVRRRDGLRESHHTIRSTEFQLFAMFCATSFHACLNFIYLAFPTSSDYLRTTPPKRKAVLIYDVFSTFSIIAHRAVVDFCLLEREISSQIASQGSLFGPCDFSTAAFV